MSTGKMSSAPAASNPYLSKSYVDGVYIPSGLLVLGCLIVKREWLPYAIALSLALGGWKVFSMSMDLLLLHMPAAYLFGGS
jgi:cytochrome-b5 reductase